MAFDLFRALYMLDALELDEVLPSSAGLSRVKKSIVGFPAASHMPTSFTRPV